MGTHSDGVVPVVQTSGDGKSRYISPAEVRHVRVLLGLELSECVVEVDCRVVEALRGGFLVVGSKESEGTGDGLGRRCAMQAASAHGARTMRWDSQYVPVTSLSSPKATNVDAGNTPISPSILQLRPQPTEAALKTERQVAFLRLGAVAELAATIEANV